MSDNTDKLRTETLAKLKELFQLDQPDLDFGIYKVMHSREKEIIAFIDKELLTTIQGEFGTATADAAKNELEQARKKAIEGLGKEAINADGMLADNYKNSPLGKNYLEALKMFQDSKKALAGEDAVYDHLLKFFSRYYEGGDFVSRRYYTRETNSKASVYAIPYNGEEVKLHWANADQYYVKTSENFRSFVFSPRNAREAESNLITSTIPKDKYKVHFQIKDAEEGEHDNNKEAADKKREFFLAEQTPVHYIANEFGGELFVNFEYRSVRDSDCVGKEDATNAEDDAQQEEQDDIESPNLNVGENDGNDSVSEDEDVADEAPQSSKKAKKASRKPQKSIAELREFYGFGTKAPNNAELILLDMTAGIIEAAKALPDFPEEFSSLLALDVKQAKDSLKNRPLLLKYLRQYVEKNKSDYFIHKNLKAFLKRELDFYIKNEIMRLDDIMDSDAPAVESYLTLVKVFRKIAGKLIDFLGQLEDFQKKLWLKKKFVTQCDYCITLDRVPEKYYSEIFDNEQQRKEWLENLGFPEELLVKPVQNDGIWSPSAYLMVDTKFFSHDFKYRLLAEMDDIDEKCDGLLVHSENFQALRLLQERYREQVKCIYIDPPYNTGNDGFLYKDNYQHSAWLSMIFDRILLGRQFTKRNGAILASIDESELIDLHKVLDATWGDCNFIADYVWAAGRKNDSKFISISHEYIVCYVYDKLYLKEHKIEWRQRKKGLDDIYNKYDQLKKIYGTDYSKIERELKTWFKSLPDLEPAKMQDHYSCVDERGIYFPADISWPGGGGPKYEVIHPVTHKPVTVPSRGWVYSTFERMLEKINQGLVLFGDDEKSVPCLKSYLNDHEYQAPYSVFYQDGRAATKRLRQIIGNNNFGFPKDETVIAEAISCCSTPNDLYFDFFAGSGTTGHAVINLNREDDGNRKYILVEMGDHFDTVLKPRMEKVVFSTEWKDGRPKAVKGAYNGISHCFKYMRLESYEDTLNNLVMPAEDAKAKKLPPAVKEDYMLHYMLDMEAKDSLLGIKDFANPFDGYKLNIKQPGSDASVETTVNLVETFNYLIGLRIKQYYSVQTYHVSEDAFKREKDPDLPNEEDTRLRVDGRPELQSDGAWRFQKIEGVIPRNPLKPNDGQTLKVLVIWRTLTNDREKDNAMLDWYVKEKLDLNGKHPDYDIIYVNGSSNLGTDMQEDNARCQVLPLEEMFLKKMWLMEE